MIFLVISILITTTCVWITFPTFALESGALAQQQRYFQVLIREDWDLPVRLEARLSGPLSAPGGAFAERFPAVAWLPCFQAR